MPNMHPVGQVTDLPSAAGAYPGRSGTLPHSLSILPPSASWYTFCQPC